MGSLPRSPKHVIPKRRADAVSGVIIFVMMAKMILFQPEPHAAFDGEMVCRVVQHIITDVTENQSAKHARRQIAENQKKNGIKQKGERNADAWGHHKPPPVVRIIVMNAVNDEVQPLSQTRFGFVMKEIAVDEVLEQCLEPDSQQEQHCHGGDRKVALPNG